MTVITLASGSMPLTPSINFVAAPQSLFNQLQVLMDAQQWNPTDRTQALTSLVAYHAATASVAGDKYSAVKVINRIHDDAINMVAYMWGIFGGVYGVYTMPVDAPAAGSLSEIVVTVAASRTTKTLPSLPGPKK